MTDACVAALEATAERAIDIYARQLAAGREHALARAYATAYAQAFGEGFLESFEIGRAQERARLKALYDEERRWMAHRTRFAHRRNTSGVPITHIGGTLS